MSIIYEALDVLLTLAAMVAAVASLAGWVAPPELIAFAAFMGLASARTSHWRTEKAMTASQGSPR